MRIDPPKSAAQVGRLFGLVRTKVGLTGEEAHEHLSELAAAVTRGRTARLSLLTYSEANEMITRLGGEPLPASAPLSTRTQQSRRQKAGVKQIVSASQIELMQSLWHSRAGRTRDGLRVLCRKVNKGLDRPHTTEQCNRVIEAIKSMNKRGGNPTGRKGAPLTKEAA